jgi:hypothetical protein
MGTSDVASTGRYVTGHPSDAGQGYGSYQQPINYSPYVNQLPDVMQARSDLAFQGAASKALERQQLSSLISQFGDPSALPGMLPNGQTLSQLLGQDVDPQTANLARANTIGANGAIGNSTIAQLYLAGKVSLQNALNSGLPMGAVGSGQTSYNINQANIANQQALASKAADFASTGTGYINTDLATQAKLQQAVADAVRTGTSTVMAHPDQYGVPTPKTMTVGYVPQPPPVGPQHPAFHPQPPTGIAAAGRAAWGANRGYFNPNPTIQGNTAGSIQAAGFPAAPKMPTGFSAGQRAAGAATAGFIRPTPSIYHPNYGTV